MSGERPKDVNGQAVELGGYYWAKCGDVLFGVGWFAEMSDGNIGFTGGGSTYVDQVWSDWKFVRAIPPSFSTPPAGTVRVRIPVGVSVEGKWESGNVGTCGHLLGEFETSVEDLRDREYDFIVYVEANLPVPTEIQPTTVEGQVTHGE